MPFRPKGKGWSNGLGKPGRAAHYACDESIDEGWERHPSYAFLTGEYEYEYEEPEVDPAGLESEEEETAPYRMHMRQKRPSSTGARSRRRS